MTMRLFLFCFLVLSLQSHAQEAVRPAQKVGNKWVIERFDLWKQEVTSTRENRLVEISDSLMKIESKDASSGNVLTGVVDPDGNVLEFGNRKFDPRLMLYSFPLSVGKTWTFATGSLNPSPAGRVVDKRSCEVLAYEDVTTKAGTFKAYKIKCDGTYEFRGEQVWGGEIFSTRWYSPDARYFVKHEYKTTGPRGVWEQYIDQLVSFELQK